MVQIKNIRRKESHNANLESIVVHAVQHGGVTVATDVYDQVVVFLVLVDDVQVEERLSRVCLVHFTTASFQHVDQSLPRTTISSYSMKIIGY